MAPNLEECDISDQCGVMQKIEVEVRYATEEERGQIVILKLDTDEVICSKETSKREDNQEMMIV